MAEEDRKAMVSPSAKEANFRRQKERLSSEVVWGRERRTQRKYSRDADGMSGLC